MSICLGKNCSFGLLCVSVKLNLFVFVSLPFDFEGGIWDLIVLIPDCYLSFFSPQRLITDQTMIILLFFWLKDHNKL